MRKLLSRLPKPLLERLRAGRKRYRSLRFRTRERLRPVHLGREEIKTALRAAGIREGDAVFVQAGMSSFGTIEGGPDAVIEAFRAVVGPEGLIAMPAFPLDRPALDYVRDGPPFDLNATPSKMGAVSERFRTSPGVLRSLHPTHSVSAQGPGAAALVAGHEVAETPFGNDTPFTRLVERGAWQVYFGSGVGPMTMYHAFECLRDPPFPIEVFWPQPLQARCIDGEGNELTVRTLVHDPRVLSGRIDNDARRQEIVRRHLVDAGMRSVTLGRGEILVQSLPEMLLAFEQMLEEGVTIYRPELLAEAKVEQR
jgi:aminoglycoside 3-N-acetyltransferase